MIKPSRQSTSKLLNGKSSEISTEAASKSPQQRDMFTSISPHSTTKSKSPGLKDLQTRYKKLQQKYIQVLQKTQQRNIHYQKQKKQLQRYQVIHQRDQKEIFRLRGMLGFLTKVDKEIQVNIVEDNSANFGKKEITYEQIQNQEKYNEYESTKHSSWSKLRASKASQPSFFPQEQTPNSSMLRKLSNSPYSKYRFVATINK